jgi:hypothetical protein
MQLFGRDEPAVVGVEVLEGIYHDLLLVQLVQVDGGGDELLVVNQLVAIDVDTPDNVLDLGSGAGGVQRVEVRPDHVLDLGSGAGGVQRVEVRPDHVLDLGSGEGRGAAGRGEEMARAMSLNR